MAVNQWVVITEDGVDKTNNTSTVTIKWYSKQNVTQGQTESSYNYSATGDMYIRLNRDGAKADGTGKKYNPYPIRSTYKLEKNTTNLLKKITLQVSHRANGTGSIFVYTYMNTETTSGVVKTETYKELTLIPRPASITGVKDIVLGDKCEVKWTPTQSTYKNKIRFAGSGADVWKRSPIFDTWYGDGTLKNNGDTEFDASKSIFPNQTTEYTFNNYTFSKDLANKYPNSAEGKFIAYLTTYDQNDTYIGVGKSKEFKFSLPSDMKPTISEINTIPDNSLLIERYAKNNTKKQTVWREKGILDLFISGFSKPIFKAKAMGSYSSKITNFKLGYNIATVQGYGGNIKIDNPSSEVNLSESINEIAECNLSEEVTALRWFVYATDSRQRSSETINQYYNVYNYKPPTVNLQDVSRDTNDKTKVHIRFSCNYRSLNKKNTPTITIRYRKKNTSTWASHIFPFSDMRKYCVSQNSGSLPDGVSLLVGYNGDSSKSYSFGKSHIDGFYCDYLIQGVNFDEESGYEFQIIVADLITDSESSTADIKTKMVLMDFRHGGRGLAVGKIAETDSFEVALPLSIEGGLKPIVINSGDNIYNLNSIEKTGIYVCQSAKDVKDQDADGNKVENSPVDIDKNASFLLEVLPLGATGQLLQRVTVFIEGDNLQQIMCRYMFGSGQYTKWKAIPLVGIDRTTKLILTSNFTLDDMNCRYYCTRQGSLVNLYARLKYVGEDKVAGKNIIVATLRDKNNEVPKSSLPKHPVMTMGMADSYGTCVAWVSKDNTILGASNIDTLYIRPGVDLSKNKYVEFNLTWDVDANWVLPSST